MSSRLSATSPVTKRAEFGLAGLLTVPPPTPPTTLTGTPVPVNPATGEVIGTYRDGGAQVAGAAIAAAGRCFRESSWPHDPMQRATALAHLADAYAARLDDIVDTLCAENGKMRREAAYESQWIGRALRFAAGLAVQNFGRVLDPRQGQQSMAIRQPVGVAGLIIPWNSPAYLSVRALAPALAAGCTALVKMPAQAAQTARS